MSSKGRDPGTEHEVLWFNSKITNSSKGTSDEGSGQITHRKISENSPWIQEKGNIEKQSSWGRGKWNSDGPGAQSSPQELGSLGKPLAPGLGPGKCSGSLGHLVCGRKQGGF